MQKLRMTKETHVPRAASSDGTREGLIPDRLKIGKLNSNTILKHEH
jgi:hypothetical protein